MYKRQLEELVILKTIANSLQRRVSANYHFVLTFNSALIALGAMGILQPASSAMLHNLSTIGISLKSMTNLIPEKKAQKALAFIAGHLNLNVFGTTRCVMAGKEPVKA